jgi:hypothetical protein
MSNEIKESEAMLEVWSWKEAAWAEVAHLPLAEAFRERRRIAEETVRRLGFADRTRDPRPWIEATRQASDDPKR